VGLPDDCWELRTLRRFRDGWLSRQAGGTDDIEAYYAKAPAIAEGLKNNQQALLRLYWTRIIPSALAAQVGANRLARAIYSKGMRELAAGS
jgi:predicted amino acid dehydrogenase